MKKAAPKKGGFRTFMKTAKTDLKEMTVASESVAAGEGAASASTPIVVDTVVMGAGGFSATVAMPSG